MPWTASTQTRPPTGASNSPSPRRIGGGTPRPVSSRHHIDEALVGRAVRDALVCAGLAKRATCHTFRHSFATHSLEAAYDIRKVQELLWNIDVKTTMIYTRSSTAARRAFEAPGVAYERGRYADPHKTPRRERSPDGARWCSAGQAPITLDRAGMLSDPEPVFEVLCGSVQSLLDRRRSQHDRAYFHRGSGV